LILTDDDLHCLSQGLIQHISLERIALDIPM